MARRGARVGIRSARCLLVKTEFDSQEDSVEFTMPAAGLLTPANFARKTIVTRGSFRTEFPDSNDITLTGEYWPLNQHQHPGKFYTYSLENYSEYYCVIPLNSMELLTNTILLDPGQNIMLPIGTINFVYGKNYSLADKVHVDTNVFAMEKQAAQLVAHDALRVIQCSSRPG